MKNEQQRSGQAGGWRIVPDNEQQCVWMQEGILEYKLCDRHFECETCPLDRQLRVPPLISHPEKAAAAGGYVVRIPAGEAGSDRGADRLLAAFQSFELRANFFYTRGHLWLADAPPPEYRFGIDDFHARLLPSRFTVVLTNPGSRVTRGDIVGWIQSNSQTIHLRAPIAGTVTALNADLIQDPNLLRKAPYEEGWIGRIAVPPHRPPRTGLLTAREMENLLPVDARLLCRTFISKLASGTQLGPTLHDGGIPVQRLDEAMGLHAYVETIRNFLDQLAFKHH